MCLQNAEFLGVRAGIRVHIFTTVPEKVMELLSSSSQPVTVARETALAREVMSFLTAWTVV